VSSGYSRKKHAPSKGSRVSCTTPLPTCPHNATRNGKLLHGDPSNPMMSFSDKLQATSGKMNGIVTVAHSESAGQGASAGLHHAGLNNDNTYFLCDYAKTTRKATREYHCKDSAPRPGPTNPTPQVRGDRFVLAHSHSGVLRLHSSCKVSSAAACGNPLCVCQPRTSALPSRAYSTTTRSLPHASLCSRCPIFSHTYL